MDSILSFGSFTLVPSQRKLLEAGIPVRLGSRAFDILVTLAESAGKVVSNAELMARVWPDTVVDSGALRVHIAGLRKTLGDGRAQQRYIVNVPLQGYCFVAPVIRRPLDVADTAPASASPRVDSPPDSTLSGFPASGMRPLPALISRPVGREQVIEELITELANRRCVTLVGPGGMGKTTVAIAAASAFSAKVGMQAVFVSLASLSDPALVPSAVVSALGLPEHPTDPLGEVMSHLRERKLLIVLDNCEHVIGAAAELAESLLNGCSGMHILTTSREPLRTQGEWVLRLRALRVPPEHARLSTVAMLEYSAVELFVERVRAAVDTFEMSDLEAPLVNTICRALDGIPLAIELAAARVEQIGLRGVAANLGNRLALLTRGRRTALPRHQTLRATLDWSHALLGDRERRLLQRLAIFRGKFSSKSAKAVAHPSMAESVEEDLFSLVSKSLVVTDVGSDQVQYWLLETTREYALAQLVGSDELQEVSRRHAEHMVDLADDAVRARSEESRSACAARESHLIDDLRAALIWSVGPQGERHLAANLAAASAPLWFAASLMAEYLPGVERALAALPDGMTLEPRREIALLESYGQSLWHIRGDGVASLGAFDAAARVAAAAGSHEDGLRITWGMWLVTNSLGDYRSSLSLARQFGEIAAASDNEGIELAHHRMMAMSLHLSGEHRAALGHALRVVAATEADEPSARSNGYVFDHRVAALTTLSRILWALGETDRALDHADMAVTRAQRINHSLSLCFALSVGAAPVAVWCGDWDRAERHTRLLQENTRALSLSLWQVFADGFDLLMRRRRGTSNETLASLRQPTRSLQDTLCTLDQGLADEAYFARGESGAAGWTEPELLRIKGDRCFAAGDVGSAEDHLRRSLELARRQEARSWELRCTLSLARLLMESSRSQEARDCLESIVSLLAATSSGADLRSARDLLTQLA